MRVYIYTYLLVRVCINACLYIYILTNTYISQSTLDAPKITPGAQVDAAYANAKADDLLGEVPSTLDALTQDEQLDGANSKNRRTSLGEKRRAMWEQQLDDTNALIRQMQVVLYIRMASYTYV
jgi:hypothetical protein